MKPRFNPLRYSLAASLAIGFSVTSASATSYYFDGGTVDINTNGNGASAGASGNWNTTVKNWDQGATAHFVWNNVTNAADTAVFGTYSSKTVTVSGTVTADTIQMDALSWKFTGGTIDADNFDATTKPNTTLDSNLTGTINFKATGWTGDLGTSGAVIINGNNTGLTSTTVNFNQDANHLVLNHAGALGADGADVQITKGVVNLGNTAATAISYNKWDIDLNGGSIRGRFGIQTINGPVTVSADSWLLTRAGADAGQDPKLVFSSTATIDLGVNTLSLHAAKVVDNGGIELNGVISGTGGLTQATSTLSNAGAANGTVILNANNTYTGETLVNNGTMAINGSTHASSAVSVAAGTAANTPVAKLGGTGTINGTLELAGESTAGYKNGGVLAPGDAGVVDIETLNAGTTTWNGGSIWEFDLSSTNNTSDQLVITGDLTKGTGSGFAFNFMGSQPVWNTTFTLATWTGTTGFVLGDFAAAASLATLGSGSYSTSFFTLNSNSLTFTAVPEPTSALAGFLITAGLLRRRRA